MRTTTIAPLLAALVAGCQPSPDVPEPPAGSPPPVDIAPAAPPSTPASEPTDPSSVPPRIPRDEPLREGLVELEGIVRPTKGGLDLRGVTIALETLQGVLPPEDRAITYDALLGSKVKVVVELEKRSAATPAPGEPAIQTRAGDWFAARAVHSATLVEPAVVIEGVVTRSKGLFGVGDHLVTGDDLSWSLKGDDPLGKRVRLWGQPRTYHCPPQAQCLIGGKIPMFDVGRGQLLE